MQEDEKNNKSENALREEAVLKFWDQNQIFKKTLDKKSPKGEFIFYEGPPTANGKPGIHHLEARAFKDAIPRYKTMRGYHVYRKGGWDTHGLPVELQVEKELGLNSKKAIEEYGIAKFNQECKKNVWKYLEYWNDFTKRIGYWVDQDNPYVTYHNSYIESVWNILKKVNEENLLYKDYKVVPWCPRCGTALSSHELAQGYENVKDLSVTAKFKVKGQDNTYLLAWTTTPWTLPDNVALAVGKDIEYVKIKTKGEILILAKNRLIILGDNSYEILQTLKGSELVDLVYEPLYQYLVQNISDTEKPKLEKAYRVYPANFVTTEDGTGIVHTAVMYGQDDFILGTQIGLPKFHLVNPDGKFLQNTDFLSGRFVKDEEVAVDIIKDLASRGLLFHKEKYEHSYPFCWRCKTPLIYYARDSWYIRMSSLREKLIKENQTINWEPEHTRDGRFGEWLSEVKDWALSRERYWGTPLPAWNCKSCNKLCVIGSISELQSKTKKSGNTYFIMRHGETTHNVKNLVSVTLNSGSHLTEKGKEETIKSAKSLKGKGIDLIITSPFNRTQETSKIVADTISLDHKDIILDDRLHEISVPMYEGRAWAEYHRDFPKTVENWGKAPEGNESYEGMKRRSMNFLFELEEKYKNKKILIVTHGGPSWLMIAGARMLDTEKTLALIRDNKDFHYLKNSEIQDLPFVSFPHDKNYDLDLHRPYIDEVSLACDCGGDQERTKEVIDVWFDSGAMPFAEYHYPFENKKWIEGKGYPADFISEAIDQTRGWFYTLHAIGILMDRGKAFKNVICLGHLLDKDGKKMSKSLGNIVDPWEMIDKYGVDSLRLWMYSVNQPGESKNFDEKTISELHGKVFNLLYNVLAFYELYRNKEEEKEKYKESKNILDRWIVARLNTLIEFSTSQLDEYKLLNPVREMQKFIDDLSTWYLRRSRDRLKNGDKDAKKTLYFILRNLTQIMAPLAPFSTEDIWQKLKLSDDTESVHLSSWPEFSKLGKKENKLLADMEVTREICRVANSLRQKANIPVRQPLSLLKIKKSDLGEEYLEIIKDEINVKEIKIDSSMQIEVNLETHISLELRGEGQYRELVRAIQDMRKEKGLNPSDVITLEVKTGTEGQELINKFKDELAKTINAKEIKICDTSGTDIKIGDIEFEIKIS